MNFNFCPVDGACLAGGLSSLSYFRWGGDAEAMKNESLVLGMVSLFYIALLCKLKTRMPS